MTMVTARNCTETRFNQLWDALHEKSSAENESLFQQELHRCRSKRQRSKLAGRFAGAWQTLFDAFCEGRVFCSLLDSVIHQESISAGNAHNRPSVAARFSPKTTTRSESFVVVRYFNSGVSPRRRFISWMFDQVA